MKRIILNLDLDDNQILDEEIEKLIRDRVKQITRETIAVTIEGECNRVIEDKVASIKNVWSEPSRKFKEKVAETIRDTLCDAVREQFTLRGESFNDIVADHMDRAVQAQVGSTLKEYLDQQVKITVQSKLREAFGFSSSIQRP